MKILKLLILFTLGCTAFSVKSAEFILDHGSIYMSGTIESGDADKYLAIQKNGVKLSPMDAYVTSGPFTLLKLDSLGGSVSEAIKIAKIVNTLYINVSVVPDKVCGSSCFLVFLAGSGRNASGSDYMSEKKKKEFYAGMNSIANKAGVKNRIKLAGFVGLHRPSIPNMTSLENNQSKIMKEMSSYLKDQNLPTRLIDLMMSRPSNDVYWLTTEDLQELGEYPINQEEFYIQKCGYVKNVWLKIANSNNSAEKNRLFKISEHSQLCICATGC